MEQLIKRNCKGTWRSFKTFRRSGEVKQHSTKSFQEFEFSDEGVLTIRMYQDYKVQSVLRADQWRIEFKNKSHFLHLEKDKEYEIITINHSDLVIADPATEEKTFFARLSVWEHFMKQGIISAI